LNPGEVWQYTSDLGVVFIVLDSWHVNERGLQHLRLAYLTNDRSPERVGRVYERTLSPASHVRVA
jgi:hypothetical protein